MPKEKYDPPDPRRIYTIMSAEEVANGKKSHWAELEISGEWNLKHLIQSIVTVMNRSEYCYVYFFVANFYLYEQINTRCWGISV